MRTTNQHTSKIVSAAWLFILILSGCGQTELEDLLPDSDDTSTGEPVELRISLADSPEYNNETTSPPATRSGEPLIGEWVKVNSFSATRSAEEYEGPAIAAMELFEDSVSSTPQTRANMTDGCYFRLIAFKKEGTNSYKYQSAADYIAKGASAPVLHKGKMILPMGQTYRFVAYSFNNKSSMGDLPNTYTWNSTSISIPDLSNDFMTFDSGDIKVTGESLALPVSFTHQLCKLTVQISVTGFGTNNTFSNCKNVHIEKGGKQSTWTVGASAIAANTINTASFDIANGNTSTFTRLVPFASARTITVHFGTLTVGGKDTDNTDITSSQKVQLLAGKSYTMTVQFKKRIGNKVPSEDIKMSGCTPQDKIDLAQLTWADGNLNSTGDKNYTWTTKATDYGYYYTWYSTYTGNTSTNSTDPCSKLNAATYGTEWRTPSYNEITKLARCTDGVLTGGGMWFMNKTKGIFLSAGGGVLYGGGSGLTPTKYAGERGYYWSSDLDSNGNGHMMMFYAGQSTLSFATKPNGLSVRCVKGKKQ